LVVAAKGSNSVPPWFVHLDQDLAVVINLDVAIAAAEKPVFSQSYCFQRQLAMM